MKRTIIYAVLAVGMAAVSCSKSGLEAPGEPGKPNAEPVTVALSSVSAPVSASAFDGGPGTKSAPEMIEGALDGQLHDLWAIQYDKDGKLVGTPYYTTELPAGAAGVAGSGTDYAYSGLSIKLTSSGADTHTVYFIGNTHNGSLFTADNDVSTTGKLNAAMLGIGTEYKPTAAGGIVMMGKYTGPVASGTPLTGIRLERMAAKIILKYKSALNGFTVTGVQLKNVPAAFGFADAPAEDVNFPAVADGSHIDYPAEDIATAGADGDYKTFVWYVPENLSRTMTPVTAIGDRTLDKSDGRPAYVEVSGVLKTDERVRKAVYRILLGDPSLDMGNFQVKRNHIYTVTLDIQGLNQGDNRVTVESFDMSNCAMLLPAARSGVARDSVVFDIRKCLSNGFTTQADLNALMTASSALSADVLWQDAQNVLTTADVTLDKVNGLLTVKSSKATVGNAVVALYPNADKKQGEILWSWHIWISDYRPGDAGVTTRTANTAYTVPGGQVHTYGTEFRKANGTTKVIMDRNLGATKAYYAAPAAGDATADQSFGFHYQWGRKDPFPRADGATVNPDNLTPVATMSIYGADGTVLPEGAIGDATALGLKKIYVTTVLSGALNSLPYSVKNPLAFISENKNVQSDWYTLTEEGRNDALWGDGGPKAAYDPCPKGWRVPPTGTWNDFTRDETVPANGTFPCYINGEIKEWSEVLKTLYIVNGRLYDNFVWYPASGFLHRQQIAQASVGYDEQIFSSTPAGTKVKAMYGNPMEFKPENESFRSQARAVRCIQE